MPNTASSRSAQLIEKRNELAATVRSRKRKLCELYAVTTSPDPHPAPLTPESQPPDSALHQFLAQNDIESGRLFDESSLPPRPKVDWVPPSPPEDVDDTDTAEESGFHATPHSPSQPARDHSRLASPQTSSHRTSSGPTPEVGISTQHAEADLPNGSIPTPRSAAEHDDVLRFQRDKLPPPNKAATPHSPPDSPRSQYEDGDTSRPETFPSRALRARQEGHELAQNDDNGSQVRQGSAPPPALAADVETFEQLQDTGTKHGATTRSHGRGTSLPPPGSPRRKGLGRKTSNRTSPRKTPERLMDTDAQAQQKRRDGRNLSVPPDQDDALLDVPGTPTKTSVDRQDTAQPARDDSPQRDPLSNVENRNLAPKRSIDRASDAVMLPNKKRLKREKPTVVVKLAKADRYTSATRQRGFAGGPDYRHPGGKKDYMHILFLQKALDTPTAFKTDLGSLLASTSKTLTTSDWDATLREKTESAVVKRVYDLQQRNAWCLRQPKSYPEPARPSTHWDHLLREAKWLQTDFREERKLKLSVCAELAYWCREWYEASISTRAAMQVRNDCGVTHLGRDEISSGSDELERQTPLSDVGEESLLNHHKELEGIFNPRALPDTLFGQDFLDEDLSERLPLFEPWKSMSPPEQTSSMSADMQRMAEVRQAIVPDGHGVGDEAPAPEIPPEDTECAIFDPAWKTLRARVNSSTTFRMPTSQMPPMGFYEHRRASQWTPEDDHQLKQYAKDFPSNWALISDRLSSRSTFTPSINRRTPWECYERLLSMEGVYTDPGMRQYARQFSVTIERIRARWQQNVQQSMQAQGVTQLQSPPRFPAPQRVERKMPSRRFACILEGARKLAKKRENESSRRHSQHESQVQVARTLPQSRPEFSRTPQDWSKLKFEREENQKRKAAQLRQQQAAFMQAQQQNARQPNQSLYNGGLAQRTGSRGADTPQGASTANGHLAVPGTNAHRSQGSQPSAQMPVANGAQSSNQLAAQLAMGGRPQTGIPMQQRAAPGFNASGQHVSEQNMQQLMAAQARQQQAAFQAHRQMGQSHVGQGSPTLGNVNGMSNASPLNPFSSTNGDALQSPRLPPGTQSGSNQTSPNLAHQMMAQFGGGRPHQLSSGHVTVLDSLRHNITQENPQLSADEVMNLATSRLQKNMRDQNSVHFAQNRALNAAAGVPQIPQQQQQRPPTQQGLSNPSQSPYPNPQQSPYLQNSMHGMQGRSTSPGNPLQQQQSYTQSMQAQISSQMLRNGLVSPTGGGGSNPASSPPMSSAMVPGMGFPARTPTPGQNPMRPPSSAMMDQRPGSANTMGLSAGSPRPMSSQGVQ